MSTLVSAPTARSTAFTRTWVSTTYFAQGLPFMLINFLFAAYLTDIGVKEAWIGYLNYFGLAWSLKFLWAPAVDFWGTKRRWLLSVQGALVIGFGVLTLLMVNGPRDAASANHSVLLQASIAMLALLAVLAATHDIAIDGYYMEAITNPGEQAAYTGLRSLAFQVAKLFVRSALLALTGWIGWHWGFGVGAVALAVVFLFHFMMLPRVEVARTHRTTVPDALAGFGRAFLSYLRQPGIKLVLALLVTYKLGDQLMFALNTTFLMREVGVTKPDLAWIGGILGSAALTAGSLLSAWAIQKYGWRRAVWPLTLAMNLNIWLYVWLAWTVAQAKIDPSHAAPGLPLVAFVYSFEQFAGGLGSSALIVFALRTCNSDFKAAHYAIATALASLGGATLGAKAGEIVMAVGYTKLFLLSFAVAVPSMVILPFALRLPQLQDPDR
jgi:PAT family beta-lactamase induction signal transducer AmpG